MTDGRHAESYLAEWYLPNLAEPTVDDVVARLSAAASAVTGEGTPVRLTMTLANPSDEVLYGVFDVAEYYDPWVQDLLDPCTSYLPVGL